MTRVSRLMRGAALAGVLAGLLFLMLLALAYRPAIAAIARPDPQGFALHQIQQGAALARIGNCTSCHTASHGRAFAGGVALPTAFGTIYGTNITPDPATGIGSWSRAAFARAMRSGIARDGRQLYPAFPYDHFSALRDADIAALYAFLMTRQPVRSAAPANRLVPPLGFRPVVAVWKILYFRPRPIPAESDLLFDRGAYLADAVAHCGACHTPHNFAGAEHPSRRFAGAVIEGWYAPPLDRTSPAVRAWTQERLFTYLRTGLSPSHAAAAGPMGPVARNLAQAPERDVRAIAAFVAQGLGTAPAAHAEPRLTDRGIAAARAHPLGASLFEGACAVCHAPGARMMVEGRPPLPLGSPLHEDNPRDTIQIILAGLDPPVGESGPYMPSFAAALTDPQIADLVAYLHARYGSGGDWPALEQAVARGRREAAK